jgi:hypothetical protein
VDLEVHVVFVWQCFELLEVGYILLGVFLGLGCDKGDKVEVIGSEGDIKKSVRLYKPTYEL